jgi:hypothetical protein
MQDEASVNGQVDANQDGSESDRSEKSGGKTPAADASPFSPKAADIIRRVKQLAGPSKLQNLRLPQGNWKYHQCASELFAGMAATKKYVVRDKVLLTCNDGQLQTITPTKLQSRVEKVFYTYKIDEKGNQYPVLLNGAESAVLLETEELETCSNPLRLIVQVPPLILDDSGGLQLLDTGYHPESGGLWVVESIPGIRLDIPLAEAKEWLVDKLFADYDFVTPGDLSRAVAQVISPALKIGGLLGDVDYPMDFALANKSQSGKTHRMKFTARIYGETAYSKPRSDGGVGSLDESIGAALHSGKPFILFDNVRGDISSQILESVLRGAKRVAVRLPYSKEVLIDTTRAIIQLTSNDAAPTKDLMNRSLIISNRKQTKGYTPKLPWGDDFLQYIDQNQAQYLSAVYSVIVAWWNQGKPKTRETGHDFREWIQAMDWIVQNLLGLKPLLGGQTTVTAGWFRDIIRHLHPDQIGEKLDYGTLLRIADENDIEIPGDNGKLSGLDQDRVRRQNLGRKLSNTIYRDSGVVLVDGYKITRTEEKNEHGDRIRYYTVEEEPLPE